MNWNIYENLVYLDSYKWENLLTMIISQTPPTNNFRLYENWKTTMKKRNNLSGQAWNNAESS